MKWIKASDKIPEPPFTARIIGTHNAISYESLIVEKRKGNTDFINLVEILDESPSTEVGQQGVEIKKIFEYIQRNANKINEHTWKVYKEQILAHVEDGIAISSQPQVGQDELWEEFRKSLTKWINNLDDHRTPEQFFNTAKQQFTLIKK